MAKEQAVLVVLAALVAVVVVAAATAAEALADVVENMAVALVMLIVNQFPERLGRAQSE
jgi:uncharacterized membrane protein YoaK (UPF0700 family)